MDVNDDKGAEGGSGHGRQFTPHQLYDVINLPITSLQVCSEATLRLQHLQDSTAT